MRIGFVGPVLPIRSGIAQHASHLVDALCQRGHTVDVESWSAQYPRLLYPHRQIGDQPRMPGARYQLKWWNPIGWVAAGRRLSACDLVVVVWVTPFHALPLRTILAAARRRAVVVVHNSRPHEHMPLSEPLTRLLLRRADRAVVHAAAVAQDIGTIVPGMDATVVELPPNLHIDEVPPPSRPPMRLLSLGVVRHYKGIDLAVEAIARLRQEGIDVRLTVAGEDWGSGDALRQMVDRLDLGDVVQLDLAWVDDDRVGELLAEHHAVVASYRSATQSAVIALAHAAGRPVVVTPVGGLPEAVRDGTDGLVAAEVSSLAIADSVRRLDADYEKLADGAHHAGADWLDVADVVTA